MSETNIENSQEYANRILQAFDAFAKRNNLAYWLGYGTLLQDAQARAGNSKGHKTREEAKQDVFKYIELYYNRQRMHSSIGYNAPCDLERDVA